MLPVETVFNNKGAKLEMHALRERQELQRELEEAEEGKAELSRKLELLDARTKVKQAEIDLLTEQSVEHEMKDGMNEWLEEYYTKGQPCNEPWPAPTANGVKPISTPRSLIGKQKATAPLTEPSIPWSELPKLPVQEFVETKAVVTCSLTPNEVSMTGIKVIFSTTVEPTRLMRTTICATESDPLYTLTGLSPVRSQSTPRISMQPQSSQNVGLNAAVADFFPVMSSQQTATPIASYPSPLREGQSSLPS